MALAWPSSTTGVASSSPTGSMGVELDPRAGKLFQLLAALFAVLGQRGIGAALLRGSLVRMTVDPLTQTESESGGRAEMVKRGRAIGVDEQDLLNRVLCGVHE